jgi:hypothetical protein
MRTLVKITNDELKTDEIKEKSNSIYYIWPSPDSKEGWTELANFNFSRVSYLGKGHSSKVFRIKDEDSGIDYAEKVRKSSELSKLVYFMAFQAPSPDRNENAVRAAVLTRNILKVLLKRWHDEDGRIPLMSNALGYRWDEKENTYSIITEFIEGRGPNPNSHEIFDLMKSMNLLLQHLFSAGFVGACWQTDKSNMTSTANFKFNEKEDTWYWIDTEPGMIALSLGRKKKYLKASRDAGFSPLFADIDFNKLRNYLKKEGINNLDHTVDSLEYNMKEWKDSEIALLRNRSLLNQKTKESYIENWSKERFLSQKTQKKLQDSHLAFFMYLFLGSIASFALNSRYRFTKVEDFFKILEDEDIISKGYRKHYFMNQILYKLCPKFIHHYLMCRPFRKYINKGFYSRKHRRNIAEDFINEGVTQWEDSGRLSAKEAHKIRENYQSNGTMDVYVTGFGAHLLLKGITIFGDILAIMNILGTSGLKFLEPLVLEFLLIDFLPWPLNAMAPLFIGPLLRLAYVAYSKYRCIKEGRKVPHGIAAIFSFGKFGVGNMAFPAQMLWSEKRFTMEYLLSKLGKKFPLFGGTDSRIEHWFIRRSNIKDTFSTMKSRIAHKFSRFHFRKPYTPDILGGKASKRSKLTGGQINVRLINITLIILYIILLFYILIFRIFLNIIGSNESEYYPIEIITTMGVIFSIVIIFLISIENRLKLEKNYIFYPILIATFIAFYLGENNWLYGREAFVGVLIFGGVFGLVLIFGLKYVYSVKKEAGFIFGIGIFLLTFGTFIDTAVDGYIPLDLNILRIGSIEETCELYAVLLFLHSFLIVYFNEETGFPIYIKDRTELAYMAMGAAVFGFGNSLLLANNGRPAPIERILLGLMIIAFAMVILILNFRKLIYIGISKKPVDDKKKVINVKRHVKISTYTGSTVKLDAEKRVKEDLNEHPDLANINAIEGNKEIIIGTVRENPDKDQVTVNMDNKFL